MSASQRGPPTDGSVSIYLLEQILSPKLATRRLVGWVMSARGAAHAEAAEEPVRDDFTGDWILRDPNTWWPDTRHQPSTTPPRCGVGGMQRWQFDFQLYLHCCSQGLDAVPLRPVIVSQRYFGQHNISFAFRKCQLSALI